MSEQYRFLNTETLNAAMNMAIDESVQMHYLQNSAPPTLRVFRWVQPSISLGRFQSVEREIDSDRCQQLGVALVRRPTGGRAVYHRDEFTYSIVIGKRDGVPAGVVAAYAYLAQGLIDASGSQGDTKHRPCGASGRSPRNSWTARIGAAAAQACGMFASA